MGVVVIELDLEPYRDWGMGREQDSTSMEIKYICRSGQSSLETNYFLKIFIYLFLEIGEGRKKERERNIDMSNIIWLPLVRASTRD